MAKLFGLDIPSGLEDLFRAVLQLKPNFDVVGVGLTLPKVTQAKRAILYNRSLMVAYKTFYNSLSSMQRSAWNDSWGGTPFSDHSGAGGWPGSGYSYFIYINASRHHFGLVPFADPPASELITFGLAISDASSGDEDLYPLLTLKKYDFTATSNDAAAGLLEITAVHFPVFFTSISLKHRVGSSWVELLTNGNFESGLTGWTVGTGTIVAEYDGCILHSLAVLQQAVTIVDGDDYRLSYLVQASPQP